MDKVRTTSEVNKSVRKNKDVQFYISQNTFSSILKKK